MLWLWTGQPQSTWSELVDTKVVLCMVPSINTAFRSGHRSLRVVSSSTAIISSIQAIHKFSHMYIARNDVNWRPLGFCIGTRLETWAAMLPRKIKLLEKYNFWKGGYKLRTGCQHGNTRKKQQWRIRTLDRDEGKGDQRACVLSA